MIVSREGAIEDEAQYPRESIEAGDTDALARIAAMIRPGATVLDLGTARGALGRALSARGCVVDGVELDASSAEIARAHYRRLQTADLEQAEIPSLFPGEQYDVVVCADVLEHLRDPERVLAFVPGLLREGGELLVSVPNVGYTGLVLDLLFGHFEYRPRGLLDRTHVRFFTRESVIDLLERAGFGVHLIEPLPVALEDSEFSRIPPERLDPALLATLCRQPDGRAYQFLLRAVPGGTTAREVRLPNEDAAIGFQTQLYWHEPGEPFQELQSRSILRSYGESRHRVTFTVPSGSSRLRWDPIDRPGLVSIHRLELRDGRGSRVWSSDGSDLLESAISPAIRWTRSSLPVSFLSLGADPWIELPLPAPIVGGDSAELTIDFSVSPSQEALRTAEVLGAAEEKVAQVLARSSELLGQLDQRVSVLEGASRSASEERRQARDALDVVEERLNEAVEKLSGLSVGLDRLRILQAMELQRLRELQDAQARGMEARMRRVLAGALRTATGLGSGELAHELELRPLADVDLDGRGMRATGPDPQVELCPLRGSYPQGEVRLRCRLETEVDEGSLYVDLGLGYSEERRIRLTPGRNDVHLTLPPSTRGLRIDPRESPGEFLLTEVELVEPSPSEPWWVRLGRGLRSR
jgi:2-polyprenyl-3-methyl-5-hydroxy-6-metoxy-1,4-benzoquinol methylase